MIVFFFIQIAGGALLISRARDNFVHLLQWSTWMNFSNSSSTWSRCFFEDRVSLQYIQSCPATSSHLVNDPSLLHPCSKDISMSFFALPRHAHRHLSVLLISLPQLPFVLLKSFHSAEITFSSSLRFRLRFPFQWFAVLLGWLRLLEPQHGTFPSNRTVWRTDLRKLVLATVESTTTKVPTDVKSNRGVGQRKSRSRSWRQWFRISSWMNSSSSPSTVSLCFFSESCSSLLQDRQKESILLRILEIRIRRLDSCYGGASWQRSVKHLLIFDRDTTICRRSARRSPGYDQETYLCPASSSQLVNNETWLKIAIVFFLHSTQTAIQTKIDIRVPVRHLESTTCNSKADFYVVD